MFGRVTNAIRKEDTVVRIHCPWN